VHKVRRGEKLREGRERFGFFALAEFPLRKDEKEKREEWQEGCEGLRETAIERREPMRAALEALYAT
jgi:hypothetical protein